MYVKIFSSIFDGSMRGHSDLILVFVNLLCHADRDGIVDRHWQAIVDETGLSEDKVIAAIKKLEGIDKEAVSSVFDGRWLRRISPYKTWGWVIRLNPNRFNRPCTEIWKRIKERIFKRDNYTCQYCGIRGVLFECDHVVPLVKGGNNKDYNLATACRRCNRSKSSKLFNEWIN